MTIGQLGHHPGMHVSVDVQGKTVNGVLVQAEQWMPGVIVGTSVLGNYLTVELDGGNGLVSMDDAQRVRPMTLTDVAPGGVPQEIVDLVRAGKTLQAIKKYRELNGASMDEAKAAIANL